MNGGERKHFTCTRQVWAFVTKHPRATVREIAEGVGLATATAHAALTDLCYAGYITQESGGGSGRTRIVLVPFITEFRVRERAWEES